MEKSVKNVWLTLFPVNMATIGNILGDSDV